MSVLGPPNGTMHSLAIAVALATARLAAQPAAVGPPAGAEVPALIGDWELNLARTHYGPGVDRRRRERFTCALHGAPVACTIRGERADGRVVVGRFTAGLDGAGAPVAGIPGVDEVRLRAAGPGVLDATFLDRGAPAFGYRAYRSDDGRSLTVVAVDPTTRAALTTVVAYDRR